MTRCQRGWGRVWAVLVAAWLAGFSFAGVHAQALSKADAAAMLSAAEAAAEKGDFQQAFETARERWAKIEQSEIGEAGTPGANTAKALAATAWFGLMAGRNLEALAAASRANQLAPDQVWIAGNLAHALMMLGRIEDAQILYRANRGKPVFQGRSEIWEESIESDLKTFLRAGIGEREINEFIKATGELISHRVLLPQVPEKIEKEAARQLNAYSSQVAKLRGDGQSTDALAVMHEAVILAKEMLGENHTLVGLWLRGLADLQFAIDPSIDARPLYRRALSIIQYNVGHEHPDTLLPLQTLASLDLAAGDLVSARQWADRAIRISQSRGTALAAELADTFDQLAEIDAKDKGNAAKEVTLQRGLAEISLLVGAGHEAVARLRVKLGSAYEMSGRLREADGLFVLALPVLEAAAQPDHALIALVLGSRVNYVQKSKSQFQLMLELQQRQLVHIEQLSLPNKNLVWRTRSSIAGTLSLLKRYAEAEDLLRLTLAYREQERSPDQLEIAGILFTYGTLCLTMERNSEAVAFFERSLEIREGLPGANEKNIDVTLGQLALAFKKTNRNTESEKAYLRQIELLERRYGPKGKTLALSRGGLAGLYTNMERLVEAGRLYELSVDAIEAAADAENNDVASVLDGFGLWQKHKGLYDEAEGTLRRSLALREEQYGTEAVETARSLSGLASVLGKAGRPMEAVALYRKSIAIHEKSSGAQGTRIDIEYNNIATELTTVGQFSEADKLFRKALDMRSAIYGEESGEYAQTLGNFAGYLSAIGDDKAALEAYERSLAIQEKVHGLWHSDVAIALNNVAVLYSSTGRYAEAERAYRRAIGIDEKVHGADGVATLTNLHNFAVHLSTLGRTVEALKLYDRVVEARERVLGPFHVQLATTLTQQSNVLAKVGRHEEAINVARRAVEIERSVYGPNHYHVADSLAAIGSAYADAEKYDEAIDHHEQALDIRLNALAPGHPVLAHSYNNIASALHKLGRYEDAEVLYRKALTIRERALGRGSRGAQAVRGNLAFLTFARQDWDAAIVELNAHIKDVVASPSLSTTSTYELSAATTDGIVGSSIAVVQAAAKFLQEGKQLAPKTGDAVFAAMQWYVAGSASARLNQAGLRWAARDPKIAGLIRERQDIGNQIVGLDRRIVATWSVEAANRDKVAESEAGLQFKRLQGRQSEIEQQIRTDYPAYFDLVVSQPLSIAELQSHLRDNEVVVNVVSVHKKERRASPDFHDHAGVVLAITRTGHRFVPMDLRGEDIEDVTDALRCGLDASTWGNEGAATCSKLIGSKEAYVQLNGRLPFDLVRAHGLYTTVFGGIGDLIEGKHLLIMSAWPLAQLPWQVLVVGKPVTQFATTASLRGVDWLGKRHPITVLPSPASLRVLRSSARPSAAHRTWIGFGNPLLDGPEPRYATTAQLARDRQRCSTLEMPRLNEFSTLSRTVNTRGDKSTWTVADIRTQAPLPETADELCEVAEALGANQTDVNLGANATKARLKRLSRDGTLASYRMLHFATHAAKAGEIAPSAEPGLILTPTDGTDGDDDGYLTATEIGELRLDADWVILSACNTASSGGDGASLSGLAQAFFFAGTRSLLVSHWYVDSVATERLIKTTLQILVANPRIGRAEALRRAMSSLIDSGNAEYSHPSKWAPFVVVGEGASR
jgi:tetratricopeptide (TPR) repeat protein/CHAT domain-containing protein